MNKSLLAAVWALGLAAAAAPAQTTVWIASAGDWSQSSNWSSLAPTAGVDAEIPGLGGPGVSTPGAICADLRIGTSGAGVAAVDVYGGGGLTVSGTAYVGDLVDGYLGVTGPSLLSVGRIVVGSAAAQGLVTVSMGTLTVGTLDVGTAGSSGTATLAGGTLDVTGDMTLAGPGGSLSAQAIFPSVLAIAGTLDLDALFQVWGSSQTIDVGAISMGSDAILSYGISGTTGISVVNVAGSVSLDGQLSVQEIAAAEGTYTVLQAGSLSGAFSSVSLPSGWTYSINRMGGPGTAGSVTVTKGTTPVQDRSWGSIKGAYAGSR